ncbi:MAG: hypothetical protein EOP51_30670 [Sphingobacteriales bacterium]|nr:MAG: hypothetical protein EOP51_30670 [Sphingobacteriales bacterium]
MIKLRLTNLFQFVLLIAVQVLMARNLPIFDVAFCYVYIGFLLFLPIQVSVVAQLLLGFVTGLTVDVFYDTLGIHTAACVFLMYLRPYIIRLLTPRDGYDANDAPNVFRMGYYWFLPYALLLIFLHHTALFFLEVFSFYMWWMTAVRILCSVLYTFLVLMIVQYLFFPVKRSGRK